MIKAGSVQFEAKVWSYLEGVFPQKIVKVLDPESWDYQNLMKIAESEGKDTKQMSLTVHANYALLGFEKNKDKITAVFVCDPLCWTENPSDWWWKSQRDNESFKDLLRKATGTRLPVRVELSGVKLLPVPRWFSETYRWKMIKK